MDRINKIHLIIKKISFWSIQLFLCAIGISQSTDSIYNTQNEKIISTIEYFSDNDDYLLPFYFESNSFIFCDQDYIEKFALLKKDYPDISIKLIGHCTNNEFKENPLLSSLRVNNIAHLLQLMGIEKNNILVEDLKNSQPLDLTGNDPKNQRVELILM